MTRKPKAPKPKPTARIEDWRFVRTQEGRHLLGRIVDHPRQGEFRKPLQVTSRIVAVDKKRGTAETRNTLYRLGAPHD